MLTVDLKVNGRLIGEVYICNEGGPNAATVYAWELHRRGHADPVARGEVTHDRDRGAFALAAMVLGQCEAHEPWRAG